MKSLIKTLSIPLIFSLLLWSACNTQKAAYQKSGRVVAVQHDNRILTLQSQGYGSDMDQAYYFAEKSAFENLFYKGIPDSNQETPLIPDAGADKKDQIDREFIQSGTYQQFITESRVVKKERSNQRFYITEEITIDLQALRNYLEENEMIKKFGL